MPRIKMLKFANEITLFEYLVETNDNFLLDVLKASRINHTMISAVPSFIFMVFSFILIYFIIHRRSNALTTTKQRIYKEMGFQWTFFYIIRIWFLIVKGFRWLSDCIDYYFKDDFMKSQETWLNRPLLQGVLFSFFLIISLIPFIVLMLSCLYKQSIPNFLMWVEEDPWLRSEIGMSGHYLDRPPNFFFPKRDKCAYRSRRSISVENTNAKILISRNCRSLETINFIKSTQEMGH